jgi:hypothetical protein
MAAQLTTLSYEQIILCKVELFYHYPPKVRQAFNTMWMAKPL